MSSPVRKVDVAILGAGTAGMRAYKAARLHTDAVVLIDPGPLGTTCARVGCMPSKLLLAAAHAAHGAERAWRFGADVQRKPVVDGEAVMRRVLSERDRFVGFILREVASWPEDAILSGTGRFLDAHTLDVQGTRVEAKATVVATGGRPVIPAPFRVLGDRLVVNDDVFAWERLPESVAIFGPGVIGLELGQALHRLGVRVRMFGMSGSFGPLSDPAVRDAARAIFAAEFPLDPRADLRGMSRDGDAVVLQFAEDGVVKEERFDYALIATGRTPNTDQLGFETLGCTLDARKQPRLNPETLQVGDLPIFLAGDAQVDRPLLHEAADEGSLAGENAARWPNLSSLRRRSALSIVFCDPQIAMVGDRWADLAGRDVVVGEVSFEDQGRSRVMLRNQGLLHVYADRTTGRLLGAEGVGPDAEHLGHLLAWAHQRRLSVSQMLEMPFYHPSIEEGLRTALRDAEAKLA